MAWASDPARGRIQALGQLVEEDHLGLVDEREGDEEPLLLAAGEAGEGCLPLSLQPPGVQDGTPWDTLGGEGGEEVQRLPYPDPVGQRRLLELAADAPAQLVGFPRGIQAEHPDPPPIRLAQALHALHRGRLAGAVGPEQAKDLPPLDLQGDIVHGEHAAVRLAQVLDLDDGSHSILADALRWSGPPRPQAAVPDGRGEKEWDAPGRSDPSMSPVADRRATSRWRSRSAGRDGSIIAS